MTHKKSLIAGVDDHGVLAEARLVKKVEKSADVVVDGLNAAKVALHVALVFKLRELGASFEGEGLARVLVNKAHVGNVIRHRHLARIEVPAGEWNQRMAR